MSTARYAGLDETNEYEMYGLAVDGEDVTVYWNFGHLTIIGDEGEIYFSTCDCSSLDEAEQEISLICGVDFTKQSTYDAPPQWQSPRRERIPRPLERQR